MVNLTAVIPVANTLKDFSRLRPNIKEALDSGIKVIFVLDQVTNQVNPDLDDLCSQMAENEEDFRLISGKFGSPGKSRNVGFSGVDTEFVVFWDADDRVQIKHIENALQEFDGLYDYIIGSYEVINLTSGLKQRVKSGQAPKQLRLINEPGIWRIIFRKSAVKNCLFGTSSMGEDQVYLVNSGVLTSKNRVFTNEIFYSYYTGVKGQLTSQRNLNMSLVKTIFEIFGTTPSLNFRSLIFRILMIVRIAATLGKRIAMGLK